MKVLQALALFFAPAFAGSVAHAQVDGKIYRTDAAYISGIKLIEGGKEKKLAWAGGVNNPQFALADLDKDGLNDLVVYETVLYPLEKSLKTFINKGTPGSPDFRYAPEYEWHFFMHPMKFMKMKDYNCDGAADFFYGYAGLFVCDGYYDVNTLKFKNCREIRYKVPVGTSNLTILGMDVPGMEDIDNDNDLDLVFFHNGQTGYIDFFRNDGQACDTFQLKYIDQCWGKVMQGTERAHSLGQSCASPKGGQEKTTHGSNGICLFDSDGDGDMDALIGNSNFSDIQYLHNGKVEYGHPVDSFISQDTAWQTGGKQVSMPMYPMAHWLDIDQDGDKDILISPQTSGENYKSIALYKNTGSDAVPSFVFQTDTFLVEEMIDQGSYSYPVLYDFNKDGKKDLFIGGSGFFQPNGTYKTALSYYENTSAGSAISFTLKESNFLKIDTVNIAGAALAIGDLDNDGFDDLVAGHIDGSISYYRNHAASANDQPIWLLEQKKLTDVSSQVIEVSDNAAPLIYDIDKDGKKDLVIGNQTGYLSFYKNITASGPVKLQYQTNKLGDVKVGGTGFGNSAPFIGKIDNTGKEYLLVGSERGHIYKYDGFQNGNTSVSYTLLDSFYSEIAIAGKYSAPVTDDLDGDNKYEMFIGNEKGGVFAYRQFWDVSIDEIASGNKLQLYPNPANDRLNIVTGGTKEVSVEVKIFNNVGQLVRTASGLARERFSVDVSALPPGVYLCALSVNGAVKNGLFVKT